MRATRARCPCRRSSKKAPGPPSVFPGEAIAHPEHEVAAQGRVAERVLVLLVEKIDGSRGQKQAAGEAVAGGHVETSVARIIDLNRIDEIRVRTHPGKIADEIPIHTRVTDVDSQRTGVDRAADQVIP